MVLNVMLFQPLISSNTALDKVMDEENSEMRKSDSLELGGRMLKNV